MTTIHRNDKNFQQIRELLSSRPRPVETGCVVKISLTKLFGRSYVNPTSTSIYGIVGNRLDYCHFTTAASYDVKFYTQDIKIPFDMLPILHYPFVENDMTIVRYPEQNASIDDPNIDRFFEKSNGIWRIKFNVNQS